MRYDIYKNLQITDDYSVIDFVSKGNKGNISKRMYNLAFGDLNEYGEIDDYSISDNGDRNKILATVVDVVKVYTAKYPDQLIFFRGSTQERTRLYRMAVDLIWKNYLLISIFMAI